MPASIPSELNKHAKATNTAREENFTKIDYQNKRRVDWKEWNLMWMLLTFWKCPGRKVSLAGKRKWFIGELRKTSSGDVVSTSIFPEKSHCAHDNTTTTNNITICAICTRINSNEHSQKKNIFPTFFKHSQKRRKFNLTQINFASISSVSLSIPPHDTLNRFLVFYIFLLLFCCWYENSMLPSLIKVAVHLFLWIDPLMPWWCHSPFMGFANLLRFFSAWTREAH